MDERGHREGLGRLGVIGLAGGVFYLLLTAAALFYLGRYTLAGARGPFWVSALGVAIVAVGLAAGGWLVRAALRGPEARRSPLFRFLSACAGATILVTSLEILGWDELATTLLFVAAFVALLSLFSRWADVPPPASDHGRPDHPGAA